MKKKLIIFLLLITCQLSFGSKSTAKSFIVLNANVYFGAQDEKAFPVETDFYLLDKSIANILRDSGFKPVTPKGKGRKLPDKNYLQALAEAFTSSDEEQNLIRLLIEKELLKHNAVKIQINYAGSAYMPVANGNYYLFGVGKVQEQILVWNTQVQIKDGSNLIEADQYNADLITDY